MQSFEPIFFQSRGAEEYRFLSNFWLSPFEASFHNIGAPVTVATVEHYYQAMKAMSYDSWRRIACAELPAEAKRLGGEVLLRDDWEKPMYSHPMGLQTPGLLTKDYFMLKGLRAKFEQHADLRAQLIATRNRPLVEYAPWGDTYWGVDKSYVGRNMLGTLLMLVRAMLGRELKA